MKSVKERFFLIKEPGIKKAGSEEPAFFIV